MTLEIGSPDVFTSSLEDFSPDLGTLRDSDPSDMKILQLLTVFDGQPLYLREIAKALGFSDQIPHHKIRTGVRRANRLLARTCPTQRIYLMSAEGCFLLRDTLRVGDSFIPKDRKNMLEDYSSLLRPALEYCMQVSVCESGFVCKSRLRKQERCFLLWLADFYPNFVGFDSLGVRDYRAWQLKQRVQEVLDLFQNSRFLIESDPCRPAKKYRLTVRPDIF